MTKEIGKAEIGDLVINHSSNSEGGCEINVYKKSSEPGNGDSVWGYDPGCNCDITSETSPAGQETYLEQKCYQLAQIQEQAGTSADYTISSETALADNSLPREYQNADMGGPVLGLLFAAIVTYGLIKTVNLKPGSGIKKKDKD